MLRLFSNLDFHSSPYRWCGCSKRQRASNENRVDSPRQLD
jgi:hypothetical protein